MKKLVGIALAIMINSVSAMDNNATFPELKNISNLHLAGTDTHEMLQDVGQENCTTYILAELVRANKRATAAIRTLGADTDDLIFGWYQPAGLKVGEFVTAFESAFLHIAADIKVPGPVNAQLTTLIMTQILVDKQLFDAIRPWFATFQSSGVEPSGNSNPLISQNDDKFWELYEFVAFKMICH